MIPGFKTLKESDEKLPPPRILIVDDDPISAALANNLLREMDATVTVVGTGQEAIDMFEAETNFDLVLMDLYLPNLNGFKTTEAIRASTHYRNRKIPIIALTSNTLMEPKAQFLKSTGFAEYITKPVRKESFTPLIKRLLPVSDPSLSWY